MWSSGEGRDSVHNGRLHFGRELGIDGQGEGFLGRPFRFREIPLRIPQITEAFLQMEWDGIINLRPDPGLPQMGHEFVPLRNAYHVLIVNVKMRRLWQSDAAIVHQASFEK